MEASNSKIKELEERCTKFKMLALKVKKELMESRSQVRTNLVTYSRVRVDY